MRFGWLFVVVVGVAELAAAQPRVIPSVRYATREYGLSGSYVVRKDADDKDITDLTVLGHWGLISDWGPQAEVEGGYGRHTLEAVDSTARDYSIAANLIMNYTLFEKLGVFGLIGYGYRRQWGDRTVGTVKISTSDGQRFFQYGGGAKWLLVPNVALRLDYRRQTGVWVKNADPRQDRQFILFGISVFQ